METIQRVPHETEHAAILGARAEASRSKDRKVRKYASPSDSINPDRRWCPFVAGESFHPHGRQHQVDLERSRGHRRGVVAPECIWTVSFPLANPRWVKNELTWT